MIDLRQSDIILLDKCLQKHAPSLTRYINSTEYIIDSDIINQMRNAVGDELVKLGLHDNYEPTEYGLQLEGLIDKLGNIFMK